MLVFGLAAAGCAGPASATDLPNHESGARKLYLVKCAKCHKLYDPGKYSDAEWRTWMGKMSKKAKLTPEQEQTLTQHIDETYRAPQKIKDAPEPKKDR